MAAARRFSPEQIVAQLREHEKLQGQGLTSPQACKRIGVSDQIGEDRYDEDLFGNALVVLARNDTLVRLVRDRGSGSWGSRRDGR
jgi:hypothetical protein